MFVTTRVRGNHERVPPTSSSYDNNRLPCMYFQVEKTTAMTTTAMTTTAMTTTAMTTTAMTVTYSIFLQQKKEKKKDDGKKVNVYTTKSMAEIE